MPPHDCKLEKQNFGLWFVFISLFLSGATATGAEKTVTGKITSVDAPKNSIKLDDLELDVSRKTKITVDGKKAILDDIKKGQQAKVTYDDSLETAISIVVGKEGDDDATAKDMKALQGEWLVVSEEVNGKPVEKKAVRSTNRQITIKGNSFSMTKVLGGKEGKEQGKFEIDATTRAFDFVGKNDGGNHVELIGIYELADDRLKLCYRYVKAENVKRPTAFKTEDKTGSLYVFIVMKRDTDTDK